MPYTFTVIDPLPSGLTLSSTGVISGTPTIAVDDDYQIQVSDGTTSEIASIHITASPYTRPIPIVKIIESYELGIQFGMELIPLGDQPTELGIEFGLSLLPPLVPILQGIEFGITTYDLPLLPLGIEFGIGIEGEFTFSSAIVAPLGRTGLTALTTDPQDDDFIAIPDLGFDFNLYGVNRRNELFIGSNSYITAGSGSTVYNSTGPTNPGLALLVGASDRSWRAIYAGSDQSGTYRVRWEGAVGSSTDGDATAFWEVTFFSDDTIMLVTGEMSFNNINGYLSDGTGSDFTIYTVIANNSYVFRPNGTSPTYTMQNGSYS